MNVKFRNKKIGTVKIEFGYLFFNLVFISNKCIEFSWFVIWFSPEGEHYEPGNFIAGFFYGLRWSKKNNVFQELFPAIRFNLLYLPKPRDRHKRISTSIRARALGFIRGLIYFQVGLSSWANSKEMQETLHRNCQSL